MHGETSLLCLLTSYGWTERSSYSSNRNNPSNLIPVAGCRAQSDDRAHRRIQFERMGHNLSPSALTSSIKKFRLDRYLAPIQRAEAVVSVQAAKFEALRLRVSAGRKDRCRWRRRVSRLS